MSTELITDLSSCCQAALQKVAPSGSPYALLDFPFYANIGDSAIWKGTRQMLEDFHGEPPSYVCSYLDFSAGRLDTFLPEGPIYIQGGGSFGDLYPRRQRFRTAIVRIYGDRVIHLPQSLHFSEAQAFDRTKELAERGSKLMVRDHPSERLARDLGFEPLLAPDAAFCLGPQAHPCEPDRDLLVLKRTDKEGKGREVAGIDWIDESPMKPAYAAMRVLFRDGRLTKLATFDYLAELRVRRGLRLLSMGKVVATDRLHGHILATLLGIPQFVSDNSTGKLTAFIDAWTKDSPLVHQIEDLAALKRSDLEEVLR